MDGDDSDIGNEHAAVMARMLEAMSTDALGPGSLSAAERGAVDSLLSELEGDLDMHGVGQGIYTPQGRYDKNLLLLTKILAVLGTFFALSYLFPSFPMHF